MAHERSIIGRTLNAVGDTRLFAGLSLLATGAMVGDWATTYYGYYHPSVFREGNKVTDNLIVNHGFLSWFAESAKPTAGYIALGTLAVGVAYLLREHPIFADRVHTGANQLEKGHPMLAKGLHAVANQLEKGHPMLADGLNTIAVAGMAYFASIYEYFPLHNVLLMLHGYHII